MNLTTRITTAAIAAAAAFGLVPATSASAEARSHASSSYRDYDNRSYRSDRDYRRDYRRDHRRDYRNRYERSNRGWNARPKHSYSRYQPPRRCWTETRWDRWRGERYRVRICR